jgi:hypothetical protein
LVVPPTRNLPPPETTGSVTQRDPAWPADPDEAKRRASKKATAERKWVDPDIWGDTLKPHELGVGKTNSAPNETGIKPGETIETSTQLRPDELGYNGGLWSDFKNLGFSREKPVEGAKFLRKRALLTDPPAGYRTPSPALRLNYNHDKDPGRTSDRRNRTAMMRFGSRRRRGKPEPTSRSDVAFFMERGGHSTCVC